MAIGFLSDDDHSFFRLHMLFGMIALFMLTIRLVLGVAGSRDSRFSSFSLQPKEVIAYIRSAVFSKTKLYPGNNPGSAMAAVLMFLLVPALFLTGIGRGRVRELHELFAWGLLLVVIAHLGGLAWHTLRHKENIALVMITGRRTGNPEDAIASAHPLWGGGILLASVLWIAALFAGYNAQSSTVRLPLTGINVPLCAGGHGRGGGESRKNTRYPAEKSQYERGDRKGHYGRGRHDDD